MKPLDDPNGVPLSSLHQHGTDEEPAYSSLVVAPSPSYLASILQAQMANAMRVAERQGDAQTQELIERKMSEIRRATPHEDGGEAEFNQAEKRLRNEVQTVNAVAKIFKALRPAIEKLFPNVFTEGNDKAYAATAYTLKLAEKIAMLDPDTRGQVFENGITYASGQNIPFDHLNAVEKRELKICMFRAPLIRVQAGLPTKTVDSVFGGVQPKGHEAASKLARKEGSGVSDEDVGIFEAVMERVQEAANKQNGVGFEKAFMARYFPHSTNGKPLRGNLQSLLYSQLKSKGMKNWRQQFHFQQRWVV